MRSPTIHTAIALVLAALFVAPVAAVEPGGNDTRDPVRHLAGAVDRVAAGVEGPPGVRPPHEHGCRCARVRRRRPARPGRREGRGHRQADRQDAPRRGLDAEPGSEGPHGAAERGRRCLGRARRQRHRVGHVGRLVLDVRRGLEVVCRDPHQLQEPHHAAVDQVDRPDCGDGQLHEPEGLLRGGVEGPHDGLGIRLRLVHDRRQHHRLRLAYLAHPRREQGNGGGRQPVRVHERHVHLAEDDRVRVRRRRLRARQALVHQRHPQRPGHDPRGRPQLRHQPLERARLRRRREPDLACRHVELHDEGLRGPVLDDGQQRPPPQPRLAPWGARLAERIREGRRRARQLVHDRPVLRQRPGQARPDPTRRRDVLRPRHAHAVRQLRQLHGRITRCRRDHDPPRGRHGQPDVLAQDDRAPRHDAVHHRSQGRAAPRRQDRHRPGLDDLVQDPVRRLERCHRPGQGRDQAEHARFVHRRRDRRTARRPHLGRRDRQRRGRELQGDPQRHERRHHPRIRPLLDRRRRRTSARATPTPSPPSTRPGTPERPRPRPSRHPRTPTPSRRQRPRRPRIPPQPRIRPRPRIPPRRPTPPRPQTRRPRRTRTRTRSRPRCRSPSPVSRRSPPSA